MDLSTVAHRVARSLRLLGTYLSTGEQVAFGRYLTDQADELDEANEADGSAPTRPAAPSKTAPHVK